MIDCRKVLDLILYVRCVIIEKSKSVISKMKEELTKEQKKILKGVDSILEKIDACFEKDAPVSLVASLLICISKFIKSSL